LNVILHAVFHLTSRVLPVMLRQKSGCLVHIASVLGLIAAPQFAAYNTAKAGLIHFSRTLAVEYGPLGIRSNTLAPGLIETEMTADLMQDADFLTELGKRYPLGRFGKPGDVAEACLFLASEAAAFITGTVLPVDGGHTAT
ncbi:MAG: SDR family NAD(P)-dependent oxidoreductase, partial [Nitrospinaceae bacterium]